MVRWKRGVQGQGVKQALAYALDGSCDAALTLARPADGVEAAVNYAPRRAHRFTVAGDTITVDALNADQLATWIDGHDPETGEPRGAQNLRPEADLLLDATINAPKTFSIAALLDPDIAAAFDALQDRIRDRTLLLWRTELNARRGKAGAFREPLARIEVVELRHERSRSLDPHRHRHLWLNVKVLGEDGRWSGIDSRVAMRFQNVINAEGELANRTDPIWLNALAAKGYTLDENGEIAGLAGLVRPLSRRSNQIEANKAARLAQWRREQPGQEPTPQDLLAIDQWAWAHDRPSKPAAVDEAAWRQRVLDEITEHNPGSIASRRAVEFESTAIDDLDLALLARIAVQNADSRSAGSAGRFSRFDVRAGVLRALANTGVVADRHALEPLVTELVERVIRDHTHDLLDDANEVPAHVKSLMALTTVRVKTDLAERMGAIAQPGAPLSADLISSERELDSNQRAAAAAVASTDRLVTVLGPAGTGKTTLLAAAIAALARQRRRCLIVAPTKKAAGVAGRETGTDAASLHALLHDHGWRFGTDRAGVPLWIRLRPGQKDHRGNIYRGPRVFNLAAGDRIVVDEAGMVDLHAARALAIVAQQTGAGLALIGDHRQLSPVGHYGALATARRVATANVDLTDVHRFRTPAGLPDAAYAELTLRIREPQNETDARAIAEVLLDRGHVVSVESQAAARLHMAERYLAANGSIALIVATNEEAQAVSQLIQQERLRRGDLISDAAALGSGGQPLYVGDLVQTRRNSTDLDVENRQNWQVRRIRRDGRVDLVSADRQMRRRTLDADYVSRDVHLAYAITAHGAQGETTDSAVTGPDVDAAGLYVGLTRGRTSNVALVTARERDTIVDRLAETLMRGRGEITLADSRVVAATELANAAGSAAAPPPAEGSTSAESPSDSVPPPMSDASIDAWAAELDPGPDLPPRQASTNAVDEGPFVSGRTGHRASLGL